MGQIAINPQTGKAKRLENGAWIDTQTARNPQTGEIRAFDGQEWRPVQNTQQPAPMNQGPIGQGSMDQGAQQVSTPPRPMSLTPQDMGQSMGQEAPQQDMTKRQAMQAKREVMQKRNDPTLEFPDAGEITDINLSGNDAWYSPSMEGFKATLKAGMTTDPTGKANILAQHFKDDPRFEGAFVDAGGNPMIRWEGQPYYINKPGFTGTDTNDLLAGVATLFPAGWVSGAPATALGRAAVALPAYGGSDALTQYAGRAAGSKEEFDPTQTGATAAIGSTIEATLPPLLRAGKRALTRSPQGAAQSTLPRYEIPLTRGQATGDIAQVSREEAMRQGARGPVAQQTMKGFEQAQREAIGAGADNLEDRIGAGIGFDGQSVTRIGTRLEDDITRARDTAKATADSAFEGLRNAPPVSFTPDSFRGMVSDMSRNLRKQGFDLGAPGMEGVRRVIGQADHFANMPNLRQVNLEAFEALRRRVMTSMPNNGSPADAALGQVKRSMDRWLDDAVTNGLMQGDEATITALKDARGLWSEYKSMFGGKDPTGRVMNKILEETRATPVQTVNYLVSITKAGDQSIARNLVQRMGQVFGKESEQFRLLKSAYLIEAFTKSTNQGVREISPGAIRKNVNYLLDGDGTVIPRELFSPDEMAALRTFADDVSKTITPREATNPSGSAWAIMRELVDRGILPSLGTGTANRAAGAVATLPFSGLIGQSIQNKMGAAAATDAVRGMQQAMNMPLLSAGLTAAGQRSDQGQEYAAQFQNFMQQAIQGQGDDKTGPMVRALMGDSARLPFLRQGQPQNPLAQALAGQGGLLGNAGTGQPEQRRRGLLSQ